MATKKTDIDKPKGLIIEFTDNFTLSDFAFLTSNLTGIKVIKSITSYYDKPDIRNMTVTRCNNLAKKKLKEFYDNFELVDPIE